MTKPAMSKQSISEAETSAASAIRARIAAAPTLTLVKQQQSGSSAEILPNFAGTDLFLREVVDACASSVAVLDETGALLYASKAWELMVRSDGLLGGLAHDAFAHFFLVDKSVLKRSRRMTTLRDQIGLLVAGKKEFQATFAHADFAHQVVVRAARLNLPGTGFRILITFEDAVSSAEVLRTTEERFRVLLEKTHILPWEADFPTARFTSVGAQAVALLGYPLEDWYKPDFWPAHLHPDDVERTVRESERLTQTCENYELEYRMIAKDHREVWFHSLVTVLRENGEPKIVRGFSIDVTRNRQAEAELRSLSGRLITAQEEERSRVARELHDGLNQRMALLSIELEQLETEKPRSLRRRVHRLQQQVQEISADIHRLSYKLHPSKLDHLGLSAATRSLCKELTESGGLKVHFQLKGSCANLPKDVTLCVFRIAQEALRNSARHSGASSAQVVLEQTATAVRLSVSDNGCGFDPNSEAIKKGLGFLSMQERLRLVDGELKISSRPMRGTRLAVSVPLKRKGSR